MVRQIPVVRYAAPIPESADPAQVIRVNGQDWWGWLDLPSSAAFRYEHPAGCFTARREPRKGGWYWYAYQKRRGVVHKAYLGKAQDLTPARLEAVAVGLARRSTEPGRPRAAPRTRLAHDASAPVHNLPAHLPPLIGREQELQALCRTLLEAERGLLTLTGTGGSGKTRLALEVGATVLERFADGAWLVELAGLGDPDLVPKAVASALGLREAPGRPVVETVRWFLRERALLLVVDNCEHLVDACARLADDLLSSCPDLRILTTSREPLRAPGEVTWRVGGLAAPDPGSSSSDPSELGRYAAVRLFADRACAARPDFAIGPENARAVGEICGRLGGLPLALELAAARLRVLPAEEIAANLDDSFRLLTGGSRTAPTRQQTLRAALDWSHDLLGAEEQALFRRLAAFAGGFDLAAAEAVCAEDPIGTADVLDLLARLVDKSLVLAEERDGHGRYRLLEPVRQYARERLTGSGEGRATEGRHAAHFLALAERAEPELRGPEQDGWLDCLEREHDNLRAALRSLHQASECVPGLRLGAALADFWWLRGHFAAGRAQLEGVLSTPEAAAPPRIRARALLGLGMLEYRTGDHAAARPHLAESIRLARLGGDLPTVAEALAHLGRMAVDAEDFDQARTFLEESLAISRSLGNRPGIARGFGHLGTLAMFTGDQPLARERLAESQALARELGDRFWVAVTHLWLALTALDLADGAEARAQLGMLDEAIYLRRHRWLIPWVLHSYARVALQQGRALSAARLSGAAEAQHDLLGVPLPPVWRRYLDDRLQAPARRALGEVAWQAARADGHGMVEALALAQAREVVGTPIVPRRGDPTAAGGSAAAVLTRREREVARLVASGLSDREIAATLIIGRRTAEAHVAHCFNKLGLPSRARLAAWAVEVGLTTADLD